MSTLNTNIERYKELEKNPLLFLRKKKSSVFENSEDYWEPIDVACNGRIPIKRLPKTVCNYMLVLVGRKYEYKGNVNLWVKPVCADNVNDWIYVINSYIQRSINEKDLYPHIYLLWFLDHCEWGKEDLLNALRKWPVESISGVAKSIEKISKCLSLLKQKAVQEVLKEIGIECKIYNPDSIVDTVQDFLIKKGSNSSTMNLFDLVDNALVYGNRSTKENVIVRLVRWLNSNEEDITYQDLPNLYCLVDNVTQHNIIQRYFHDVKLKKTNIDIQLLESFKNNPYTRFSNYRYCIYTPQEDVYLGNSLLVDCLITLFKKEGSSFQDYNGILDYVITHCDVTNPKIDLGLENFLPKCDGGAVHNTSFQGFLDYELVCRLDEKRLSDLGLLRTIESLLSDYRTPFYMCSFDNQVLKKTMHDICVDSKCEYSIKKFKEDQWKIPIQENELIQIFCETDFYGGTQDEKTINIDEIPIEGIRKQISDFISKRILSNGLFLLSANDLSTHLGRIVRENSLPILMRIRPRNDIAIGIHFDMFGILKTLTNDKDAKTNCLTDTLKFKYYRKEAEEVKHRCIQALSKDLGAEIHKDGYIEVPYDEFRLEKLLLLYHTSLKKCGNDIGIEKEEKCYLKYKDNGKYTLFCAPKLASEKDRAINKPFFWCRGKVCFRNSLQGQTLSESPSWRNYSLFHLTEIIGYNKLQITEAGFEPDNTVRTFIAVANKVVKTFHQLKCRKCGHLLYAKDGKEFNRHYYYSCINPNCSEYAHSIYLNYCYSCKKALIDSRDNKQCPNGWHICAVCGSCCNDNIFKTVAEKFLCAKKIIPESIKTKIMLKQGHNDKNIYYCYSCGEILDKNKYCHVCDKHQYSG